MLACPGASSTSGSGAPGAYKEEFGAAQVSSNLGAELTAAPLSRHSPSDFNYICNDYNSFEIRFQIVLMGLTLEISNKCEIASIEIVIITNIIEIISN